MIVVQAPPALVVGPSLADGAKLAEVRFQLGRGMELCRPEYILAAGVRPKQFTTLFGSVLRAFHPRQARRRASAGDAAAEQAAKLKKNVPYKVSKQLVELFGALGTTSWSSTRWRAVVHHVGNRTGLVLCGNLKTAADIVVKESAAFPNGDRPRPRTYAAWPAATNRCASCCASRSARTTSCCARRSAPRSRRPRRRNWASAFLLARHARAKRDRPVSGPRLRRVVHENRHDGRLWIRFQGLAASGLQLQRQALDRSRAAVFVQQDVFNRARRSPPDSHMRSKVR